MNTKVFHLDEYSSDTFHDICRHCVQFISVIIEMYFLWFFVLFHLTYFFFFLCQRACTHSMRSPFRCGSVRWLWPQLCIIWGVVAEARGTIFKANVHSSVVDQLPKHSARHKRPCHATVLETVAVQSVVDGLPATLCSRDWHLTWRSSWLPFLVVDGTGTNVSLRALRLQSWYEVSVAVGAWSSCT